MGTEAAARKGIKAVVGLTVHDASSVNGIQRRSGSADAVPFVQALESIFPTNVNVPRKAIEAADRDGDSI